MRTILFIGLTLVFFSCKKDNVNLDELNYNEFEPGKVRNRPRAIYITETYHDRYNPISNHFVKGKLDFSKYPSVPVKVRVSLRWRNEPYADDITYVVPGDSIKDFSIRVSDYIIPDSTFVGIKLYLNDELKPIEVQEGYYHFPQK